jgi:hypothetical protein
MAARDDEDVEQAEGHHTGPPGFCTFPSSSSLLLWSPSLLLSLLLFSSFLPLLLLLCPLPSPLSPHLQFSSNIFMQAAVSNNGPSTTTKKNYPKKKIGRLIKRN